jgi:hypothetical protein
MRKLRIGIIDLVVRGPRRGPFDWVMGGNLASIMPQVIGAWCRRRGHRVDYVCYTGGRGALDGLFPDADLVFISAFSEAAQTAYALSRLLRARGAVTALGGPHARCYPQDAQRFFDYVFGFTDRETLDSVLAECAPHRPLGVRVGAPRQPQELPGVRERWPFIEQALASARLFKAVPVLGSLGCPYTCSFCIDSTIPYQPLDFEAVKDDLRFLTGKFRRPNVVWHDPNFGVRFDGFLTAIEQAAPPGKIAHIAESSLSLLSEDHVKRLARAGFLAMLPGIESWYDMGNKSRTGARRGLEKVEQVSEHVNMILRHIPYVQTNFVLGTDADQGPEPFELTKLFLDKTPGAFPGYSLLTAFGQAAPLNLEYQKAGRVLPYPFFFLNNNQAMNVRPRNYGWAEFYDRIVDLVGYSFSWRAIGRRLAANRSGLPAVMNVLRAVGSEGFGRYRYHREIRRRLDADAEVRSYFEQETTALPRFHVEMMQRELGPLWDHLPAGALEHDAYAYLKSQGSRPPPVGKSPAVEAVRPSPRPSVIELPAAVPVTG